IIIVDNGSVESDTLNYMYKLQQDNLAKIIRIDIPFNYSKLNNLAVAEASGEYICFLNNDIEVISPDWLDEMAAYLSEDSVGMVGAMLLYPDNTIQHAG